MLDSRGIDRVARQITVHSHTLQRYNKTFNNEAWLLQDNTSVANGRTNMRCRWPSKPFTSETPTATFMRVRVCLPTASSPSRKNRDSRLIDSALAVLLDETAPTNHVKLHPDQLNIGSTCCSPSQTPAGFAANCPLH